MKEITVTNYKGNVYTGKWNEKTYSSKIDGMPELFRIYIDGNAIHITKEELSKIADDIKKIENNARLEDIDNFFEKVGSYELKDKLRVLWYIVDEDDVSRFLHKNGIDSLKILEIAGVACNQ